MLNVRKVDGPIGAEATGVDLSGPVAAATCGQLAAALVEHGVLIVKDQHLDPRQFLAAGSLFGEPMPIDYANPLPDLPLVQRLSSHARKADGSVQRIGPRWHTDQADHPLPPKFTALYAVELFRTGGTTGFANMRAAYEALPEATRRSIDGLQAIYLARGADGPGDQADDDAPAATRGSTPLIHPLVRTIPESGHKAIYFHPQRIQGLVGMAGTDASRLLGSLLSHALQPRFVYNHVWTLGDMVLWDNRSVLHKANYDFDPTDLTQHRCMYRMLVKGERPR